MKDDLFESSDSVRGAAHLPHARHARLEGVLPLERGGALPEVALVYESYGELAPERDNVVLVCHALSGDSHVARHDADDDPGWWDLVVGPGKAIDTDRWYVVCVNVLGGCRGSTGPDSINPVSGRPYGPDFPTITVGDMVESQRRLFDQLGIERLAAVVGGSLGGHQTLAWAARYPERIERVMAIATSPRLTVQAIAFDVVGRNAIQHDPGLRSGQDSEGEGPGVGLAIARMLGHITYLSQESMTQKFDTRRHEVGEVSSAFERKFAVGSYLAHQGERFVERFDANSYVTLSMAMDLFDLGATREALANQLAGTQCRWLVVSFTSDWLFPPFQSREVVEALVPHHERVTYCNVETDCGHDAFLLERDLPVYGELMRGFLESDGGASPEPSDVSAPDPELSSTHLFRDRRLDYDHIAALVDPAESVLDLGCGSGGLLERLRARGGRRLVGVELSERAIVRCTRRGIDVIHSDLDRGLGVFADGQFDVVVLSQTLQAMGDVEGVLNEMLRVGRRGIVSFPNAAFHRHRERLARDGRVPETSVLHSHRWYDAPPIRLFSIRDFEELCRERGLRIERRIALDTGSGREVDRDPNREADLAIFVLCR